MHNVESLVLLPEARELRFLADANVGKLAKWLRILGYDTLFMTTGDDDQLLRLARQENRILLTKDTGLMARRVVRHGLVHVVLVESDRWQEQLRQVALVTGVAFTREPFSRCVRCNTLLIAQSNKDVKERVPPYVYETQQIFKSCLGCGRIYWKGTHWERARITLAHL